MTTPPGQPDDHRDGEPGAADGREPRPGTPVATRERRHRRRKRALRAIAVVLLCVMGGLHGVTEHLAANVERVPAVFGGLDPAERPAQPTGEAARGLTFLDGCGALEHVRVRHGLPLGDLDRVRRQRNALLALHSKIVSGNLLADPLSGYEFVDAVSSRYLETHSSAVLGGAPR